MNSLKKADKLKEMLKQIAPRNLESLSVPPPMTADWKAWIPVQL
jgi:hypothetical protein